MAHTINLRSYEKILNITDGETILESALEAGIDYPFGCKSGNCGACKSELHSGEVQLAPYSEFALTEEEKERDLILACRAIPLSNCEVSPIGQDETVNHPHRSMNTEITNITKATHDIRILQMEISFGDMVRQLPNQTEVAGLLVDISQTGLAAGLEFKLFEPKKENPKEFYAVLPISIDVVGGYHQFGEFISGLAQLPRIVTTHDIHITSKSTKAAEALLFQMKTIAKTYRALEENEEQ